MLALDGKSIQRRLVKVIIALERTLPFEPRVEAAVREDSVRRPGANGGVVEGQAGPGPAAVPDGGVEPADVAPEPAAQARRDSAPRASEKEVMGLRK